ncbi:sulfurtransferase [Tenacibaculum sp. C7A-26P2]|uniref:sulfurtransferase n=1 Tax=Tenacibaculum sp. C7A-26P2 TaxID=3447504 RepID=UPI003F875D4E
MKLTMKTPLVSTHWLNDRLGVDNLIILDGTIGKNSSLDNSAKNYIPGTIFFDIQNNFSQMNSNLPNTIPSKEQFEKEVRKLGVNNDSCVVVYDSIGIYSSARVWWLFKTFGFHNIAILNGGLPEWKADGFPLENKVISFKKEYGDFKAKKNSNNIRSTADVLGIVKSREAYILDARSEGRFYGTEPEPRAGLTSGHIPTSINLPYSDLQIKGKMKSRPELLEIFADLKIGDKPLVFSCGSGITACVLVLGATIAGYKNISVYDGSWTAWASNKELPIDNKRQG